MGDLAKELEGLSDKDLFDAVATVEAELAKAKAALALKAPKLTKTEGVTACFEGTPIDCGAVADVVIATYVQSLSTPELEAVKAKTEADLAAASSALAAKQSAAAKASSALPPATPSSLQTASSDVLNQMAETLSPVIAKGGALLEEVSDKTGVPRSTIAAGLVGGAIAAGVRQAHWISAACRLPGRTCAALVPTETRPTAVDARTRVLCRLCIRSSLLTDTPLDPHPLAIGVALVSAFSRKR